MYINDEFGVGATNCSTYVNNCVNDAICSIVFFGVCDHN